MYIVKSAVKFWVYFVCKNLKIELLCLDCFSRDSADMQFSFPIRAYDLASTLSLGLHLL